MLDLVMFTKSECLLCDRLEDIISRLIIDSGCINIKYIDIENDQELIDLYRYRVPVLIYNNKILLEGRPEEDEVLEVLQKLDLV